MSICELGWNEKNCIFHFTDMTNLLMVYMGKIPSCTLCTGNILEHVVHIVTTVP